MQSFAQNDVDYFLAAKVTPTTTTAKKTWINRNHQSVKTISFFFVFVFVFLVPFCLFIVFHFSANGAIFFSLNF